MRVNKRNEELAGDPASGARSLDMRHGVLMVLTMWKVTVCISHTRASLRILFDTKRTMFLPVMQMQPRLQYRIHKHTSIRPSVRPCFSQTAHQRKEKEKE